MDDIHESFKKISFQLHKYRFCNLFHSHLQEIFKVPNTMVCLKNYVPTNFHDPTTLLAQSLSNINVHSHLVKYFLALDHDKEFFVHEEIKWQRLVLLLIL